MVDADIIKATVSKELVMSVKKVGLVKANKDLSAYHAMPQYQGSYHLPTGSTQWSQQQRVTGQGGS